MKSLIISALLICSASVFAKGGDHLRCTRCMATGQANGQTVYGWGIARLYDSDAKKSAYDTCTKKGGENCVVKYCYARQRCSLTGEQ